MSEKYYNLQNVFYSLQTVALGGKSINLSTPPSLPPRPLITAITSERVSLVHCKHLHEYMCTTEANSPVSCKVKSLFFAYLQAKYKDKGSELAEEQLNQMSKQLDAFRANLEEFAANHRNDIKKNPEFRRHFQEMCATIGVDPLACE